MNYNRYSPSHHFHPQMTPHAAGYMMHPQFAAAQGYQSDGVMYYSQIPPEMYPQMHLGMQQPVQQMMPSAMQLPPQPQNTNLSQTPEGPLDYPKNGELLGQEKKNLAEIGSLQNTIYELKHEKKSLQSTIKTHETSLNDKNQELKKLRENNDELSKEIKTLNEQLSSDSAKTKEEHLKEARSLRENNKTLSEDKKQLNTKLTTALKTNKQNSAIIKSLSQEKEDFKKQLESGSELIKANDEKIELLKKKNDEVIKEKDELNNKLSSESQQKDEQIKSLSKKNEDFNSKLENASQICKKLKSELDASNKKLLTASKNKALPVQADVTLDKVSYLALKTTASIGNATLLLSFSKWKTQQNILLNVYGAYGIIESYDKASGSLLAIRYQKILEYFKTLNCSKNKEEFDKTKTEISRLFQEINANIQENTHNFQERTAQNALKIKHVLTTKDTNEAASLLSEKDIKIQELTEEVQSLSTFLQTISEENEKYRIENEKYKTHSNTNETQAPAESAQTIHLDEDQYPSLPSVKKPLKGKTVTVEELQREIAAIQSRLNNETRDKNNIQAINKKQAQQIKELQEKMKEKSLSNQPLYDKINHLKQKLENRAVAVQKFDPKDENTRLLITEKESLAQQLAANKKSYTKDNGKLQKTIRELETSNEKLANDNRTLQKQLKELKATQVEVDNIVTKEDPTTINTPENTSESDVSTSSIKELTQKIKALEDLNKELQIALDNSKAKISKLTEEKKNSDSDAECLENIKNRLTKRSFHLEKQVKEYLDELTKANTRSDELESSSNKLSSLVQQTNAANDILLNYTKSLHESLMDLKSSFKSLDLEKKDLNPKEVTDDFKKLSIHLYNLIDMNKTSIESMNIPLTDSRCKPQLNILYPRSIELMQNIINEIQSMLSLNFQIACDSTKITNEIFDALGSEITKYPPSQRKQKNNTQNAMLPHNIQCKLQEIIKQFKHNNKNSILPKFKILSKNLIRLQEEVTNHTNNVSIIKFSPEINNIFLQMSGIFSQDNQDNLLKMINMEKVDSTNPLSKDLQKNNMDSMLSEGQAKTIIKVTTMLKATSDHLTQPMDYKIDINSPLYNDALINSISFLNNRCNTFIDALNDIIDTNVNANSHYDASYDYQFIHLFRSIFNIVINSLILHKVTSTSAIVNIKGNNDKLLMRCTINSKNGYFSFAPGLSATTFLPYEMINFNVINDASLLWFQFPEKNKIKCPSPNLQNIIDNLKSTLDKYKEDALSLIDSKGHYMKASIKPIFDCYHNITSELLTLLTEEMVTIPPKYKHQSLHLSLNMHRSRIQMLDIFISSSVKNNTQTVNTIHDNQFTLKIPQSKRENTLYAYVTVNSQSSQILSQALLNEEEHFTDTASKITEIPVQSDAKNENTSPAAPSDTATQPIAKNTEIDTKTSVKEVDLDKSQIILDTPSGPMTTTFFDIETSGPLSAEQTNELLTNEALKSELKKLTSDLMLKNPNFFKMHQSTRIPIEIGFNGPDLTVSYKPEAVKKVNSVVSSQSNTDLQANSTIPDTESSMAATLQNQPTT